MASNDKRVRRHSHPVRLAVLMLIGAVIGGLFSPPMISITIGALVGLAFDLFIRLGDRYQAESLSGKASKRTEAEDKP